jgi:hypothetical protein
MMIPKEGERQREGKKKEEDEEEEGHVYFNGLHLVCNYLDGGIC